MVQPDLPIWQIQSSLRRMCLLIAGQLAGNLVDLVEVFQLIVESLISLGGTELARFRLDTRIE